MLNCQFRYKKYIIFFCFCLDFFSDQMQFAPHNKIALHSISLFFSSYYWIRSFFVCVSFAFTSYHWYGKPIIFEIYGCSQSRENRSQHFSLLLLLLLSLYYLDWHFFVFVPFSFFIHALQNRMEIKLYTNMRQNSIHHTKMK